MEAFSRSFLKHPPFLRQVQACIRVQANRRRRGKSKTDAWPEGKRIEGSCVDKLCPIENPCVFCIAPDSRQAGACGLWPSSTRWVECMFPTRTHTMWEVPLRSTDRSAPIAQPAEAADLKSAQCEFESRWGHHTLYLMSGCAPAFPTLSDSPCRVASELESPETTSVIADLVLHIKHRYFRRCVP